MSDKGNDEPALMSASASLLFDALLHQTQDQVYFKDRHSRFIRVSDAVAKKFGLGAAEEMIGKSDFDFFSEEHAREAFEDEQSLMVKDERLINKTEKETWPDGTITWVTSTKVPLHIGPGKPVGIMGITRDITERVVAERALADSREQLRQKNEEMATDFENAGRVQQRLIPGPLPEHSKVELAVLNLSYSDVGGDVITFPLVSKNYLSFLLGDVSGHGLSAG
jgi:sigma-B regulation protein RsbU (phosphoserine phosphatase)